MSSTRSLRGGRSAWSGALSATQPHRVLLHGDFHPGNVLAAAREPWLAIDCKPLVGDPAYDLAQWLGNRCETVEQLMAASMSLHAAASIV